jgi:hypothetical protein
MLPSRVFPLALALAVLSLGPAAAQFGGMPGMPGGMSPGGGGMSPGGGGSPFDAPPQQQAPPPACRQLMVFRDETQKHGQALQEAGKKKLPPEEVCKLFKAFLAAEGKMAKGLEDNSSTCGVPPDVVKQVKASHAKASQMGKQVCEAAAQGPRPAGPSLSDALGTTPSVPDASAGKKGYGTFDTLTGTPLAR